jgi:serine/threonine-protein kinase
MFLDEGRLIARLVHPNIVRTLEVGADADHDFIAMELMQGKTLAAVYDAVVARDVRLNAELAAWCAARVADALHYAHELTDEQQKPLALVHRDVNPANVFATFDGQVKLFDFGLAKSTSGERTGRHMIAGKLSYLSPEQLMQMPLDRRTDVFSLGITLWELLTSKRLFRRDTDVDTVRAVQLGPIPDPRTVAPEVPEELAQIVKTALERNREHRYASTAALARELDAFALARASAEDLRTRIAQLVETLFPEEQKRQAGWLKPAIRASRSMNAVTTDASGGPLSAPPPPSAPTSSQRPPPVPSARPNAPVPSVLPPRPSSPPKRR